MGEQKLAAFLTGKPRATRSLLHCIVLEGWIVGYLNCSPCETERGNTQKVPSFVASSAWWSGSWEVTRVLDA